MSYIKSSSTLVKIKAQGVVNTVGQAGGIGSLAVARFKSIAGGETSFVAGGPGSTGDPLFGKIAFLAARSSGVAPMQVILTGVPNFEQVKVVGNDVSWLTDLGVDEEIIIVGK